MSKTNRSRIDATRDIAQGQSIELLASLQSVEMLLFMYRTLLEHSDRLAAKVRQAILWQRAANGLEQDRALAIYAEAMETACLMASDREMAGHYRTFAGESIAANNLEDVLAGLERLRLKIVSPEYRLPYILAINLLTTLCDMGLHVTELSKRI